MSLSSLVRKVFQSNTKAETLHNTSVAIIDMGTNTFHLLIAKPAPEAAYGFETLYKEKVGVKIGQGGISKGTLTEEAIQRGLACLKTFKTTALQYGIPAAEIIATATSAIRNANNGENFVNLVKAETGIQTLVIDGETEAQLIFNGIANSGALSEEPILVMDIGGGSVEFIIGNNKGIQWKTSIEAGGQRLLEYFTHPDPIDLHSISKIATFLEIKLSTLFKEAKERNIKTLIGSSGTFDTLVDIYYQQEGLTALNADKMLHELPLSAYKLIAQDIQSKNKEERLAIPGMIALRVDMIVVALVLLNLVMEKCEIESMKVSNFALKEGVLLNVLSGKSITS